MSKVINRQRDAHLNRWDGQDNSLITQEGVGPLAAIRLLVLPALRHDVQGSGVWHRCLLRGHASGRPCRRRLAVEAKGPTGVRRPKPARSALRHADRSRKAPLPIPRVAFDGSPNRGRKSKDCSGPAATVGGVSARPQTGIARPYLVGSALMRPIIAVPESYRPWTQSLKRWGTWVYCAQVIRAQQDRCRHIEAKRLGGLHIEHGLVFRSNFARSSAAISLAKA